MCLQRFAENLGLDQAQFERDAAICSVQRNLRILMIFARMSLHFKRPHYVDLIPRVWTHLMNDLSHPDLCELSTLVRSHLPEPTPEVLARLKEKCGTVSTL
jgi:aminoglycoside/choline kinase family phosphotransferase